MNNKITINGPTNTIRLEGNINGINKVLYVYMDWHKLVTAQTQCDDLKSLDLHQYLARTFSNLSKKDKTIDLFFEISEYSSTISPSKYKNKYIDQITLLFRKEFNYHKKNLKNTTNKITNKTTNKNIIVRSITYPNIRFHYLDIRNLSFINIYDNIWEIQTNLNNIWNDLYFTKDNLDNIVWFLGQIYKEVKVIITMLQNKNISKLIKKSSFDERTTDIIQLLKKTIKKLHSSYHHKEVQKVINTYIDLTIIPQFQKLLDYNDKIFNFIKENRNIFLPPFEVLQDTEHGPLYNPLIHTFRIKLAELINMVDTQDNIFMNTNVRLTDLYMLRRFLDKDYVTNAIVYSGASHSSTYIYFLVKYFDFNITHIHYHSEKNLDILHKKIKDASKVLDIEKMFFTNVLYQCSDITNFPKNFL